MVQPIIIKKVKKGGHAHHGGAWKIAYADFVTAMMAFFRLLWLISMATPEQKEGLADYFAPPNIAETTSGAGGVMGGQVAADAGAAMGGPTLDRETNVAVPFDAADSQNIAGGGDRGLDVADLGATSGSQNDVAALEDRAFHSAAASIRQAWQAMPEVAQIADNLLVEVTEEGLDIQIVDQEGRRMFPEGSKYPLEVARQAIAALGPILQQLPNQVRISGHTAAGGTYANPRYGQWELSSDRANTVRSILGEFGLSEDHIASVIGQAGADPFFPNDPYMAANERVRITVLHGASPVPADLTP